MRIIVCIKQVPDTTEVQFDEEKGTLIRDGVPHIINPFDENAIEAALTLVEEHGGEVIVLSMGPPQTEDRLREAIAMGADRAVLLCDRALAGGDTLATSYSLAQGIRKIGDYDLIFTGKQAFDGDTGQVGPGLAEQLGIPQVTYAIEIEEVDTESNEIQVRRLLDDGFEVVRTKMPCVVTAVKQLNEPRLAGLKGRMQAKKAEIDVWTAEEIEADCDCCGLDGSPTSVIEVFTPSRDIEGEKIEGETPEEIARKLLDALSADKLV
ncbi:MAG: electron transfer flavoprotein subunit beta/FixA family protein [Armatimonadota bacterium]